MRKVFLILDLVFLPLLAVFSTFSLVKDAQSLEDKVKLLFKEGRGDKLKYGIKPLQTFLMRAWDGTVNCYGIILILLSVLVYLWRLNVFKRT